MSQSNDNEPQSVRPDADLEAQLRDHAASFSYPPTPDIAGKVHRRMNRPEPIWTPRRGLVWAILLILLALCGLIAVPEVRASILNWLRIGNIRIFLTDPTPTPVTTIMPTQVPLSGTPANRDLGRLVGRLTLAQARQQVGFAIPVPSYPAELGEPDYVYLQDFGGDFVILIWVDHDHPERILLNLQMLTDGVAIEKFTPAILKHTKVNGNDALWAVGPYMLQVLRNGQLQTDMMQLVAGNTLIWTDGDITYRLESGFTLEEAIKIAESLK